MVGGGPSGLSAALAARRAGADVILMERFGCFGGVITTVGMETIAWYRYDGTNQRIVLSFLNQSEMSIILCQPIRYEGTVDTEGIGIEMERLAAS